MFKDCSKEDQEIIVLAKNYIKMDLLSFGLVYFFCFLPVISIVIAIFTCDFTVVANIAWSILIFAYCIFICWFIKKFQEHIIKVKELLRSKLYFTRYVVRGKAILKDGFKTIKEKNKNLYNHIRKQNVKGCCYYVCFEILKCLQKGTIQFVAIKSMSGDLEDSDNEFTMHVLYVNNNWCFNTYSQTQHPLEEVMKRCKARTYRSFDYDDIAGKTYKQFREEQYLALKKWCKENDCFQQWIKEN